MEYEKLEEVVTDYFSDQSRSKSETREDLRCLIDHIKTLIESLGDDED